MTEDLEKRRLLIDVFAAGYKKALMDCGMMKKQLSKAELWRMYGRARVDRWITKGLLQSIIDEPGKDPRYDAMEAEILSNTSYWQPRKRSSKKVA